MICITLVQEGGLLLCLVEGANALMKALGPQGRYYPDSGEREKGEGEGEGEREGEGRRRGRGRRGARK